MALKLIGIGLSPFVRKTRAILAEKDLSYEHDPLVPFGVSDEHKKKHPMGKIPVLEDGDRVIPDSSAIAQYLEALHPEPSLYPTDPYLRARAVWLEEYADTAIVAGTTVLFAERVLGPLFFKREGDELKVKEALEQTLPPHFDYLEEQLGTDGWILGDTITVADIALGSAFATLTAGEGEVDTGRWPKLAAYVDRLHARPSFDKLMEEDRGAKAAAAGG